MGKNNNVMEQHSTDVDHNIELLIDKKISDAKLLAAEKRIGFTLAIGATLLTVFGIIIPLLLVFQSSSRVDSAIQRMEDRLTQLTDKLSSKVDASGQKIEDKFAILSEKSSNRIDSSTQRMEERFKELAGKQLRKPKLDCFVEGKRLSGSSLIFNPQTIKRFVELKNLGDGTAEQVRIRLYLNYVDDDLIRDLRNESWFKSEVNDRSEFVAMFIYEKESVMIPAQGSITLPWWMQNPQLRKANIKTKGLLKVFYGEPSPGEFPFTFEIQKQ
jgi:hypothetical protein